MYSIFQEKITPYYKKIAASSPPLMRMVAFTKEELKKKQYETKDPVRENPYKRGKLIHKYQSRALLLLTNRCPAHCRFCFRKNYLTASPEDISDEELIEAINFLKKRPSITELIFSGGEPLSLTNKRLKEICTKIKQKLPYLSLRLHTRYPVYEPSRLYSFAPLLKYFSVIVFHINHPDEITKELTTAIHKIRQRCQTVLLNQSVLLRKVNDDAKVLEELSRKLFELGILPYYLHYPDAALGTSHFKVSPERAIKIVMQLKKRLPGYLVPKLVKELPSNKGKFELFLLANSKNFL